MSKNSKNSITISPLAVTENSQNNNTEKALGTINSQEQVSEITNPQEQVSETTNPQEQAPETTNPDHQAAKNWESLQSSTGDYFRFMKSMGQILEDTNIESLSARSDQLAVESENHRSSSDEEIIINERITINNQSQLVAQAEYSLAERAQISNTLRQKVYNDLQGSMTSLKNNRDAALEERKNLEESWEQLLESDTENEETENQENLETTTEQAENQENLETTTEQAEDSEGKRKLDLSEQEQDESSKKQKTESQEKEPRSLIDDFADLSQEPADYTGADD